MHCILMYFIFFIIIVARMFHFSLPGMFFYDIFHYFRLIILIISLAIICLHVSVMMGQFFHSTQQKLWFHAVFTFLEENTFCKSNDFISTFCCLSNFIENVSLYPVFDGAVSLFQNLFCGP